MLVTLHDMAAAAAAPPPSPPIVPTE
eukprot:SAG31_NODE_7297_length_1728_cov_1.027010_3_plen_25_part_01